MNKEDFDALIESICAAGCISVTKTIAELEKGNPPSYLKQLNALERQSILKELKSIMDVYGGNICSL